MIKGVLIDLSGTIHVDDNPIEGALEAIAKLYERRNDIKVRFVSNTTKQSTASLLANLKSIGFTQIQSEHVRFYFGLI
jgi:ribonucleotide monophosphatase NagD (HAD superfamily)